MIKIRWLNSDRTQLTFEQMDDLINDFRNRGIKELAGPSSKPKDWIDYENHTGVFSINRRKLRVDDANPNKREGMQEVYFCNEKQDRIVYWAAKKTTDEVASQKIKAGKLIRDKFEELTDKRMRDVFGVTSYSQFGEIVPKPAYYLNKDFVKVDVDDVKLIDVTSMYPAAIQGKLPTVKECKKVNGRVAPNAEYPFAYYLKSHHCAEFNSFDTHDYFNPLKTPRELRDYLTVVHTNKKAALKYVNVPDEEEVTILMKVAKEELSDTFKYFYHQKELAQKGTYEYDEAKFVMVKGIGTLHLNPEKQSKKITDLNCYYHIAAIVKGRANQKIIDEFKAIQEDGNLPLQVVVDSIIYLQLNKDNRGIKEKKLGTFNIEYEDCTYRCNGNINRYALEKNGELVKVVVSGYKDAAKAVRKLIDIDKYVGDDDDD